MCLSLYLSEDILGALQEIQGTFQRIQTLSRRQKDHLKRIHNGRETTNGNIFFFNKAHLQIWTNVLY